MRELNSVANSMAISLDDLSDYLGPEHQNLIDRIHRKIGEAQRPHSYDALVIIARDAIDFYAELLDAVDAQNGFTSGAVSLISLTNGPR